MRLRAGVTRRPAVVLRRLAELGVVSVVCGGLALGLLQVLPATRGMSAMSQPISKYALTGLGWLFDLGVLAIALGVAGVLSALVLGRCVSVSSMAFVGMTACCIGLIALVIFPDYTSAGRLTTIGWLHWIAAVLAFGGPPVAPLVLARRHRSETGCSRLPRVAMWLSFLTCGWFAVLFGGSVLEWTLSVPIWRIGGIIERGLAATEITLAVVLAVWAWRGCACGVGFRPPRAGRAQSKTTSALQTKPTAPNMA